MAVRMTRRGGILLSTLCCVIACASVFAQGGLAQDKPAQDQPAQDQPSAQTAPQSSQQNQPQQNQTQQNQPSQSPPDQNPPAQNAAPPAEQKNETPLPERQKNETQKNRAQEKQGITSQAADATKKFGQETLNKVVDWESGWLTGPYVGKERVRVAMTAEQRRHIYLQQTFTSPSDYFKRMVSAAADQIRETPSQWNTHWSGYGERFASREGQFIAANSLAALGNAVLKYEPRYDQCKCSGFRLRTRHAILRNFLTYDQSEVSLRPQWALYGGAFGGGVISTSWKPHPRNALANGAWGVLGQAAYGSLLNFFTEFAGDINRKLGAKTRGGQ